MMAFLLKMNLVPNRFIVNGDTSEFQIFLFCLLTGIALFILMECIEVGLTPEKNVPILDQYPAGTPRFKIFRVAAVLLLLAGLGKSLSVFRHYFEADVHHNLAIFFSKQGVWNKSPKYNAKLQGFPIDIRKKYNETGGALEHYEQVGNKNPGFPMARYFTGNVYNDSGSQIMNQSFTAKRKGDMKEAVRLREKALATWDKADAAYSKTKEIAPNYVQIHHQVGLLNTKRAQQAVTWGEKEKAQSYYEEALRNFYLYRMLDPVFPPNYHRMVEILINKNNMDEAIKLYQEALYYNDVVVKQIYPRNFPKRLSDISLNLAKVYYTKATRMSPNPFQPVLPEIQEALKHFQNAVKYDPKKVEAYKGAGRILGLMGRQKEAQQYLQKAHQLAPNDPELKAAAGRKK